jgi:hypothetical protein
VLAAARDVSPEPVDAVLLLDRSASMQDVPADRVRAVTEALLRALPAGSRHHSVAFAGRAVALPASGDAARALGPSTRFDAAWAAAAPFVESRDRRLRPLLVVVGDGGLTDVAPGREAFAAAARAGVEVSAVNLGTSTVSPALRAGVLQTGGVLVEAPAGSPESLARSLAALFAPVALGDTRVKAGRTDARLGALRAGGELTWIGPVAPGATVQVPGARVVEGGDVDGETALYVAGHVAARAEVAPPVRATYPAQDLLALLRTRLLPGARGCLRRDRAGRLDYAVRAVFELAFADREVEAAQVTGPMSPELRRCLLEATESLEVPGLPGRVTVRYPIATRAEPLPSPTPMPAELAAQVEQVGVPSEDRVP